MSVLEFFASAARKLTSFPFIAALGILAIGLTQLEPLQDASPREFALYLVFAFSALFLLFLFHFATKASSVFIQISAIGLVIVISVCFAYIVVAITSRAFGGFWQPCILILDDECPMRNEEPVQRAEETPEGNRTIEGHDPPSDLLPQSNASLGETGSITVAQPNVIRPRPRPTAGIGSDDGLATSIPEKPTAETAPPTPITGRLQLPNGWIYEGIIRDGAPAEDVAVLTRRAFPSGQESYEGPISAGRPHGSGKINGIYRYGWPEKQVRFTLIGQFERGRIVQGSAQNMLLYDKGVISSSGNRLRGEYTGEVIYGEAHGSGYVRDYEGNLFVGEFNSGYFNGCMERRLTNGEVDRVRYNMGRFVDDC